MISPKDEIKQSGGVIKLKDEEFEIIPPRATAGAKFISELWERVGKPQTPLTEAGAAVMDAIINVWQNSYPKEASQWRADRKEYKNAELPTSTQVSRRTGRSLASYPYPIYLMIKRVFPTFNAAERKNAIKMCRKWPMFQFTNKI